MDAIIVGGGPAGLASAATLKHAGHEPVVLERGGRIASVWRGHYDRLHLHTSRKISHLPGQPMGAELPRFPSRDEFAAYLDRYAEANGLDIRTNSEVTAAKRTTDGGWQVTLENGETLDAPILVIAVGSASFPNQAALPGEDRYTGTMIHSGVYERPADFAGQTVLVVGFGNSGGEIALDLSEKGVAVTLSARSAVNFIPRELFGLPITSFGLVQRLFGPRIADRINAPLLRMKLGRPSDYGLKTPAMGPMEQIAREKKVPLLDIGTLDAIRKGRIRVVGGIETMEGRSVRFDDGQSGTYDAIIKATGFQPDLRTILTGADEALDELGRPKDGEPVSPLPGLYFAGYRLGPKGMLSAIREDAEAIGEHAAVRKAA